MFGSILSGLKNVGSFVGRRTIRNTASRAGRAFTNFLNGSSQQGNASPGEQAFNQASKDISLVARAGFLLATNPYLIIAIIVVVAVLGIMFFAISQLLRMGPIATDML